MKSLDWKVATASGAGLLYLLGLISFQVHLLRFGILDLSLLQTRYLVVGAWVLVTISPASVLIVLTELRLAGWIERLAHFVLVAVAFGICALIAAWYWRFPDAAQVFDFRFYAYPRWYAITNIATANGQLVVMWLALFLVRRHLGASRNTTTLVGSVLFAVVIAAHAVFFGRTVFPALSRGVGGGAPQLAQVRFDNATIDCLLIHESATALYVMRLQRSVPEARLRRSFDQLAANQTSPIRLALERNEITLVPNGEVQYVTLYGFDQKATLARYLDKHKHMFP